MSNKSHLNNNQILELCISRLTSDSLLTLRTAFRNTVLRKFSLREREIAVLIGLGFSDKEMAAHLRIKVKDAKNYHYLVREKCCEVFNIDQASTALIVSMVLASGLLGLDELGKRKFNDRTLLKAKLEKPSHDAPIEISKRRRGKRPGIGIPGVTVTFMPSLA
jgi:DNA-binding CsgD family transcriptional regulator